MQALPKYCTKLEIERDNHTCMYTPLDLECRTEWTWWKYWSNWINILRYLGIVFGLPARPVNRFENTTYFEVLRRLVWVSQGITANYLLFNLYLQVELQFSHYEHITKKGRSRIANS